MYKYIFFFSALFFVSCNSDNSTEELIDKSLELVISNENIVFTNNQFSINENCDKIFLNVSETSSSKNLNFFLEIELTEKANIGKVFFVDYDDNNRQFKTADFNASENFVLKNFTFDLATKSLSFEFSGVLYEINSPENTKSISGVIKVDDLQTIDCSFSPLMLSAMVNQKTFDAIEVVGKRDDNLSKWIAISDDDIKFELITDKSIRDMPVGNYPFTKNDIINIVSIEKFIGKPNAGQFRLLRDEDWESYEYEGEFIIEAHINDVNPITKGTFNIKAFMGEELVYEVTNGSFSL